MKIIDSEKFPIISWANDIDPGALQQAKNLANLPFIFQHVCLMPDVHQGYGMPIGGVIACKNAIIPNAVGVDIGCGVCATKTSLTVKPEQNILKKIIQEITRAIPLGFRHHPRPQHCEEVEEQLSQFSKKSIIHKEAQSLRCQLGTLGGGNHFIEIQQGSDGYIWFMLHSGSRNIGKKVADHHNKIAVNISKQINSSVPKSWGLAYLPSHTEEAKTYIREMQFCLDFAKANRSIMNKQIMDIFFDNTNCDFNQPLDVHHNYACWEKHFSKKVLVHRKGAISAQKDEAGIIPGSQGSCSYIINGKGNPQSFMSCSHGAGRVMGRNQAIKNLDLEKEIKLLNDKGIIHSVKSKRDLDEAPSAYKNIELVIEEQKDLLEVDLRLDPLAVIKGS